MARRSGVGEYKHEEHKDIISCSEIGKILGMDMNCSRRLLFKSKVEGFRLPTKMTAWLQKRLLFGSYMEAPAIAWYSKTFNTHITRFPLMLHPEFEHIGGTVDGVAEDGAVIEIKWRTHPTIEAAAPYEKPPRHQYLQLQGYLQIHGRDYGYILCCSLHNGCRRFKVLRDDELWNFCEPCLTQFYNMWTNVKNGSLNYHVALQACLVNKSERERNTREIDTSMKRSCFCDFESFDPFMNVITCA
jgi:hypothetical protein